MRHRKKGNPKLGRGTREQRKALIRSLVTALFEHGKIRTTFTRAKAIQPKVDRLVKKFQKKDDMNAIREAKKVLYTVKSSKKAKEVAAQFKGQASGFTKIIPLGLRDGDAAKMVQIEFIKNEA